MARNPHFDETSTDPGRPAPRYKGESPLFSRGQLDVRYPVDYAAQRAHRYPSNRQPLLNQPPMEGPSQRSHHVNPRMRHINARGMMGGIGGLKEQQTSGLWQTWKKILERTGNENLANQWLSGQQTAEMGGYGYGPDPNKTYGDFYGGQDIIDMEILPGAGYGPDDEYDFDYKRDRFDDLITWPNYAARGGLMSLRK